jgi:hypothetical protein
VTDTGKIGDPTPSLRVFYDSDTGDVLGMTGGGEAFGTRIYDFPNVNVEDLADFPDDYTVHDEGVWAQLIRRSDGALIDEETHTVTG